MIHFSRKAIRKSWKEIYWSKPLKSRKFSSGSDQISIEAFKSKEDFYLEEIYRQLEGGVFVFSPLKEFTQKRPGKKKPRQIQSPAVKDRIVQKIINRHLVSKYFKENFGKYGIVGSVEGNSLKSVIAKLISFHNQGFTYVLKTDIIDYFPSINKTRLMKIISKFIKDRDELNFIKNYLASSKLEGIPQGPPLSPLMANVYISRIDKYLSSRKNIRHIRYVDDLLVFCRTKAEAEKVYSYVKKEFGKLNLQIHPLDENNGKTKIEKFSSGNIDALGIVYKNNKLLIKPKKLLEFRNEVVNPLAFHKVLNKLRGKSVEEKLEELRKNLNYKLNGWGGTYAFCDIEDIYKQLDKAVSTKLHSLLNNLIRFRKIQMTNSQKNDFIKSIVSLEKIKLKTH